MNETVQIDVTVQQLNVILAGIAKLPIEQGLEVFNLLQKQASEQLNKQPQGPLADKIVD